MIKKIVALLFISFSAQNSLICSSQEEALLERLNRLNKEDLAFLMELNEEDQAFLYKANPNAFRKMLAKKGAEDRKKSIENYNTEIGLFIKKTISALKKGGNLKNLLIHGAFFFRGGMHSDMYVHQNGSLTAKDSLAAAEVKRIASLLGIKNLRFLSDINSLSDSDLSQIESSNKKILLVVNPADVLLDPSWYANDSTKYAHAESFRKNFLSLTAKATRNLLVIGFANSVGLLDPESLKRFHYKIGHFRI